MSERLRAIVCAVKESTEKRESRWARSFVGRPCVEGERTNHEAEDWCGEELAQYTSFYSSEQSSTVCAKMLRQGLRSWQKGKCTDEKRSNGRRNYELNVKARRAAG